MITTTPTRPPFVSVTLSEGLRWRGGGGFVFQEKLDGRFCIQEHGGAIMVGELMRGSFTAFDLVQLDSQDLRREPLRVRLELLRGLGVLVVAHGNGGEFLEAVLARGGEGVVAKDLEAPYGAPWWKCKRIESWDCVVVEKDPARGTIRLALDGEDCGFCNCQAAFDSVQVGDVVEIVAHSRHSSGKLREARFSFVRSRPDKSSDGAVFIR